jgi:hypothetical protein
MDIFTLHLRAFTYTCRQEYVLTYTHTTYIHECKILSGNYLVILHSLVGSWLSEFSLSHDVHRKWRITYREVMIYAIIKS